MDTEVDQPIVNVNNFIDMRTIYFLILAFSSLQINAQCIAPAPSYTNFEWDVLQIGYVNTSDLNSVKSGFLFGSELRFNACDDVSFGIETDFSFFFSDIENEDDYDLRIISNSAIITDFYGSTNSAYRSFFGFGIGHNTTQERLIRNGEEFSSSEEISSLVLSVRIGYEFNRFRIKAQYNFNTIKEVPNYLTVKMAFTLWGGYNGD